MRLRAKYSNVRKVLSDASVLFLQQKPIDSTLKQEYGKLSKVTDTFCVLVAYTDRKYF